MSSKRQRTADQQSAGRQARAGSRASAKRPKTSKAVGRRGRPKSLDLAASSGATKKKFSLQNLKIADLYRPLKKPVTLRLDADVLAWFKKDGSRYQTRINKALRKVMEREIKES
ncbi:MAG TPA: BrnA antitoxin family protein [Candidatus Sulfotelmatobacter sp.]|nr:BrnA antitoxin family protein [Candidatus Sulfotelmatobacter sp.]